MNHIPVVYATANDFEYTVVSMTSVLSAANHITFYDFYILVDDSFEEKDRLLINECFEAHTKRCQIIFKNVGNVFDNAPLNTDFIGKPTYYRLLIPRLIPENKCIYLDSDTIIRTDLQDLFETDMQENYIAGVKAPAYIAGGEKEDYCRQALLPDIKQYINAGVLLMNLEQMRKNNLEDKFLSLLSFNMWGQDQDIINSTCYNKILFLPFAYNLMTKYAEWRVAMYEGIFTEKELKSAWNNPKIIHYADRIKPWKSFRCALGDYWWMVCKQSPMWEFFYKKMEDAFFLEAVYRFDTCKNGITTKKTTNWFDLYDKEKMVVYGAGNRAQCLISYLREEGIEPEFILVSDSKKNPPILDGIEVKSINNLTEDFSNKVLVIATLEKYHEEIFLQLQNYRFKEMIPLCDEWEWKENE